MSGAKGPLGSLQDEILFSTTPSFGTESLGKPRPGKNAAAKPRGTTGSMGPVILPRLPAAVKKPVVIEPIMSASHSPVRPKSQPSVQVPESRRPAQAIQPAATKPAQSAAAVPTSAPTPSRQEIVQQSRSQVREPVPAANRVDSKPAAKSSAASGAPPVRPPPSLSAAPAPAPASQPTISPVARPTSGARRAGRTLPSTEPAPAPVSRPSSGA